MSTHAAERLFNGNLEAAVSPPGWVLTQNITGQPTLGLSAVEQISFADENSAGLGLFIKPWSGNRDDYAGLNYPINVSLSQTVTAAPNRKYTFEGGFNFPGDGDSMTNDGYSGGVTVLDSTSPSDPGMTGTVASPTETYIELAFLNSANAVIGVPTQLDLRDTAMRMNDGVWQHHSLPQLTAPAGTAKVRVTAAATNIVENSGSQNVYWDSFSLLEDLGIPGVNPISKLTNGNLNTVGPPDGYNLVELDNMGGCPATGCPDNASFINFANHTPGGQQGLWIRAFEGGQTSLSQTVTATAGGQYDFSAWSLWEVGYCGGFGDPSVLTYQRLEFLDASDAVIGTQTLNLATAGQTNDPDLSGGASAADWAQYTVSGVAPAGTAKVRASVGASGLYNSGFNPQSAFFDDLSLIETLATLDGDYNGDGMVDAADYVVWRDGDSPDSTEAGYTLWVNNFGDPGAGAATATPEPGALTLAAAASALAMAWRRRR